MNDNFKKAIDTFSIFISGFFIGAVIGLLLIMIILSVINL